MSTIEIARLAGLATVQDAGRAGHMHEGVPRGGALVPELLARANAQLGNPPGAAAIELFGRMTVRAGEGGVTVATEAQRPVVLPPGGELELSVSSSFRVTYLAVRGTIVVPSVLGGRGTLLVAGLGGFEGRALRRGDRLLVGDPTGCVAEAQGAGGSFDLDGPVRLIVGPDTDRFDGASLAVLVSSTFTILPSSDRVGTRLEGPPLLRQDRDDGLSAPMVPGAIEVPGSGPPIVLGPDHPTTGGYPVLAVVARADLGRFAARRVGAPLRFALVSLEEARALRGR
jgi:5-oxoprolinase (ATP-hydrolysing) subunit C